MNILITGGSGFVGSHMARRLVSSARDTRVTLWLRPTSSFWRLDDIKDKVTITPIDLTDAEAVKTAAHALRPEVIYHFANAGVYGGVSAPPKKLLEVNTEGLINLLDGLDSVPYRSFVNVGSSSEYGRKAMPMSEADVCEPQNFYGISKLAATLTASMHANLKGKPIATYRIFSPFGPYDDASRLISRTILACLRKAHIMLPNPACVRDYIFIDDVIDLFVEALSRVPHGEVFNVGSGAEVKTIDVAYRIADIMGARDHLDALPRTEGALPPSESPRWQADMEKTFKAFSWRPRHSLTEGLAKTVEWFKENASLYQ